MEKERLRAELRRQRERLENPDFREMVKATRLLRRAAGSGDLSLKKEAEILEKRLAALVPSGSWRGPPAARKPTRDSAFEERVHSWIREEVGTRFRELEKGLNENLQTIMETDVRIIRELRSLRESDHPRRPEPM